MTEFDVLLRFALLVLAAVLALATFGYAAQGSIALQRRNPALALAALGPLRPERLRALLASAWSGRGYRAEELPSPDMLHLVAPGERLIVRLASGVDAAAITDVRSLAAAVAASGAQGGVLLSPLQPDAQAARAARALRVRLIGPAGLWALIETQIDPKERRRASRRLDRAKFGRVWLPAYAGLLCACFAGVLLAGFGWGPDLLAHEPGVRAQDMPVRTSALAGACRERQERATQGFESSPAISCASE